MTAQDSSQDSSRAAVPAAVPPASSSTWPPALPGLDLGDLAPTTLRPSPGSASSRLGRGGRPLPSERDELLLVALSALRLLTSGQLCRLLFATGSELTQTRRARRTLARLVESGLIDRTGRQVGGVHGGSSGYVYALTGRGQARIAAAGPAGGRRRRRHWEPSPAFQAHLLGISEIYVALVEAARGSAALELTRFQPEPHSWRRFASLGGGLAVLKPDAALALAHGDDEQLCFIEFDRATESLRVIHRQCQAYLDYHASGQEQAREGVFPQVLWLVPDTHRARQIEGLIKRLPPLAGDLFAVAEADVATHALIASLLPLPALSGPPESEGKAGDTKAVDKTATSGPDPPESSLPP